MQARRRARAHTHTHTHTHARARTFTEQTNIYEHTRNVSANDFLLDFDIGRPHNSSDSYFLLICPVNITIVFILKQTSFLTQLCVSQSFACVPFSAVVVTSHFSLFYLRTLT